MNNNTQAVFQNKQASFWLAQWRGPFKIPHSCVVEADSESLAISRAETEAVRKGLQIEHGTLSVAPYIEKGIAAFAPLPIQSSKKADPAIAAMNYALSQSCECPMEFLRCWREGNWESIRSEWPDCPIECFIDEADYYKYPVGEAS